MLISSIGVFGIVAKSAFVNSDRYISPIYALIFVEVYTALNRILNKAAGNNKLGGMIFAACVGLTTIGSMVNANWGYAVLPRGSVL